MPVRVSGLHLLSRLSGAGKKRAIWGLQILVGEGCRILPRFNHRPEGRGRILGDAAGAHSNMVH